MGKIIILSFGHRRQFFFGPPRDLFCPMCTPGLVLSKQLKVQFKLRDLKKILTFSAKNKGRK